MGAWFQCTNCEARYQFDVSLAGRALACRHCGFVFRVPPVPVGAAPDTGAVSAGSGRWYLRFVSGRQFGPVQPEVIAEWVREGRADGDSLVSPEGSEEWFRLSDAFPELTGEKKSATPAGGWDSAPSRAGLLPASGLLDCLPDERGELTPSIRAQHDEASGALDKELRRAMGAVRLNGVRSVMLSEPHLAMSMKQRETGQMRADHLLAAELTAHGSAFYLLIPWGPMGRMAHEFFSILPGRLPHPVALRRGSEDAFGAGQWIGINGAEDDVVAVAARRSREDLISGISWNWFSARREFTMVQVWGVQAVPLGQEKFLHAIQTSPRGPGGNEMGVLWYLERQSAFYRFARRLSIPDTYESHVLFGCCTGRILTRVVDALQTGPAEMSED